MEFELIQKYPGLPDWVKEGDKALKSTDPDVDEYAITKFDRRPYLAITLRVEDVENNPNFWKPIPKKKVLFEIMSFKANYTHAKKYERKMDGSFIGSSIRSRELEFFLKNSNTYSVQTIKRLSDGQKFSIGDYTNKGKISTITADGTVCTDEGFIFGCRTSAWSELKHSQKREYKILKMKIRDGEPPYKINKLSQGSCHSRIKNGHKIHTIERLSDGEVFSIGDYIVYINGKSPRSIEGFSLTDDKLKATVQLESGLRQYYSIGHLQKAEPYLVTEDGAKIYKGTTLLFQPRRDTSVEENYVVGSTLACAAKYPVFYRKKACEEWIEMNKPKYSESEVEIIKQSI